MSAVIFLTLLACHDSVMPVLFFEVIVSQGADHEIEINLDTLGIVACWFISFCKLCVCS
jgi:hypothetical protein